MFAVYSNTTAPTAAAYMNALYGSNGFPMLGIFGSSKFVSARSVAANTGALSLPSGWPIQIGGTSLDQGTAVATDLSGNVFVGGFSISTSLNLYNRDGSINTTFTNLGSYDAFFAKYTSAGVLVWAARIASSAAPEYINGLATDSSGSVFISGNYTSALTLYNGNGSIGGTLPAAGYTSYAFIAKYSSGGSVLWAARIASTGPTITGLSTATDTSGNVFMCGAYTSNVAVFNADTTQATTPIGGGGGGYLLKYSSVGVFSWAAQVGGPQVSSIAVDSSGNAVIAGFGTSSTQIFFNSDGTTAKSYTAATGVSNAYVAKYLGATGFLTWAGRIGSTTSVSGHGVAVDSGNNVLVTGTAGNPNPVRFYNSNDTVGATLTSLANSAFIAKYSSAGSVVWAAQGTHGGGGSNRGFAITTDSNANVIMTGNTASTIITFSNANGTSSGVVLSNRGPAGSNDCFVAQYTSAGVVSWAAQIAGTGNDFGTGIATDSSGSVYVTGYYNSSALTLCNSGGTTAATLPNAGSEDMFVAKYSSSGSFINSVASLPASSNVLVSATYTPSTFSPFGNGSAYSTLPGTTLATTGVFVGGPSNYFNGTISELLIYSANLTSNQRQQVEGYLIQKWGLSAQTVAGHQYKLIPPATVVP